MSEIAANERHESPGGVFGIALGLGLFAIAALSVASVRGTANEDPQLLWIEQFATENPPAGYEFTSASSLPEGARVVHLRRIGADPIESSDRSEGGGDEGGEDDWVDWSSAKEGAAGSPPDELVLLLFPASQAKSMFESYFQDLPRRSAGELEGSGGNVIIESGELEWQGYRTNYVRQRRYKMVEEEPSFFESIRTNLSIGSPCVFVALWPRGAPAGTQSVEALLAQIEPRGLVAED